MTARERNQRFLDRLTPEQRAALEAIQARHRTPEARARQAEALAALKAEVETTGGITTADGAFHRVKLHKPE